MYLKIDMNNNSKNALLIECNNFSEQNKIELVEIINSELDNYVNKKYFIEISGLGGTIDTFIEETKSKNYIYIDHYKNRFFAKKLSNIYVLTEHTQDICSAAKYFGSFNEGYINITIINSSEDSSISKSSLVDLKNFIDKNSILEISVEPDGNILSIKECNSHINLIKISSAICKLALSLKF